jgi:hypothetical protein
MSVSPGAYAFPLTTALGPAGTTVTAGSGSVNRSTQDRLVDAVFNVKDFGAKGDNSTDDSAAIQTAIDYLNQTSSGDRTIYFPAGTYLLGTSSIRLNPDYSNGAHHNGLGIILRGAGRDVTILKGNYTGTTNEMGDHPGGLLVAHAFNLNPAFTDGRSPYAMSDMTIWNQSTTANTYAMIWQAIQGGNGDAALAVLSNMRLIGSSGLFWGSNAFNCTIINCVAQYVGTVSSFPTADQYVPLDVSTLSVSTEGFLLSQGVFMNNAAIGFDVGFANTATGLPSFSGQGNSCVFIGNKAYRCKVGFGIGFGVHGTIAHGSTCVSNWAERCQVGWITAFNGGMVGTAAVTGTIGPADASSVTSVASTDGGTTVTCTTSPNHNIPNNTYYVKLIGLDNWLPTGNTTGIVPLVSVTSNTFKFNSTKTSGPATGTWTYPIIGGMSIINDGVIAGCYLGSDSNNPLPVSHRHIDFTLFSNTVNGAFGPAIVAINAPTWSPTIVNGGGYISNNTPRIKLVGCSSASTSGTGSLSQEITVAMLPMPYDHQQGGFPTVLMDPGDVYYVSDSVSVNFGDTLQGVVVTSSATASGNTLHFSSVPPNIVGGNVFTLFDASTGSYPGFAGLTISSISGNDLVLSGNVSQNIPAGATVGFKRGGGSSGRYKVRWDGVGWVRCG